MRVEVKDNGNECGTRPSRTEEGAGMFLAMATGHEDYHLIRLCGTRAEAEEACREHKVEVARVAKMGDNKYEMPSEFIFCKRTKIVEFDVSGRPKC